MSLVSYKILTALGSGVVGSRLWTAFRDRRAARAASKPVVAETVADEPVDAPEAEWLDDVHGLRSLATTDRRIALSGAAFGLSVAGGMGVPVLGFCALPLLGASTAGIVSDALGLIRRRERVAVALLDLTSSVIIVTSGHYALIAFSQTAYHGSRRLLAMTEQRARASLSETVASRPQTVVKLDGDVERNVSLAEVEVGDVVVIAAGQVVPVDGRIVRGEALADQRMLTGESQPDERGLGDVLLASSLLVRGRVHLAVERAGADTLAEQIAGFMRRTDDFKSGVLARGERIVDRGARPTLAASAVALPFLGLQSALAINFAAFGYNMRIAAPLTVLSYLESASDAGMLVKDGRCLELLAGVDLFVFDKTGTLTEEQPEVGRIVTLPGHAAGDVLRLAAAAEQGQVHPIANALLSHAAARGIELPPVRDAACALGLGLQVDIDGREVIVGSARMMARAGIEIPAGFPAGLEDDGASSWVFVAIDGQLAGSIELAPALRADAAETIAELRRRGMEIAILSGDRAGPTHSIARRLGVDRVYAGMLPDDKARTIDELRDAGHRICFVGDGINDAIALKKADVSVSISGAASVAVDAAGVILMDGSLSHLVALLDLTRRLEADLDRGVLISVAPGVGVVGGVLLFGMSVGGALVVYNIALATAVANALRPWVEQRTGRSLRRSTPHEPLFGQREGA